jgi:hypothetical protein
MRLDDTTLTRAIHDGMLRMDAHRVTRARVCEEIAGPWYGRTHTPNSRDLTDKRPVNVLAEMVYAYQAQLVGNYVTTRVTAKSHFLRGEAKLRELMLNDLSREIDLARTVRLAVLDALTGGLGIIRVGNRAGAEVCHIEGKNYDVGQVYAARVDLDDYCRDPLSRDESEDRWRCYRYRTDLETALVLWPEAADILMSAPKTRDITDTFDSGLDELGGIRGRQDETADIIELWDFFAFEKGVVLHTTLAGTIDKLSKIREPKEYEGYENGPLHLLSFRHIPNNAQPIAICQQLMDLHLAMANTSAKMVDQILTAKNVYVTRPEGEQTALEIRDGVDQSIVHGDPTAITSIEVGGVMQKLLPAFDWMRAEANNASGAASLIAGQSDVSKTATGASYMANQASIRLNDMKGAVQKFTGDVLRHCAWYHDNHPALRQTFSHKLPSGAGTIDIMYDSDAKEGAFTEFQFESVPVSESAMDPSIRQARIGQFMQTGVPFLQFVMAAGGDMQATLAHLGDVYDWPELPAIFPTPEALAIAQMIAQAVPQGMGGMPQRPGQPQGQQPAQPSPTGGPINQIRSDMAPTVPTA